MSKSIPQCFTLLVKYKFAFTTKPSPCHETSFRQIHPTHNSALSVHTKKCASEIVYHLNFYVKNIHLLQIMSSNAFLKYGKDKKAQYSLKKHKIARVNGFKNLGMGGS